MVRSFDMKVKVVDDDERRGRGQKSILILLSPPLAPVVSLQSLLPSTDHRLDLR